MSERSIHDLAREAIAKGPVTEAGSREAYAKALDGVLLSRFRLVFPEYAAGPDAIVSECLRGRHLLDAEAQLRDVMNLSGVTEQEPAGGVEVAAEPEGG